MRTKEWLKERRTELGLTQKDLANKCNISVPAIAKIELGERLGSTETWSKIETVLGDNEIRISYDTDELINELKYDIEEFGKDKECILVYKKVGSYLVFTNYDFICEEEPFNPKKELCKGEKYITTTLQYALEVFEDQNKII